MKQRRALPCLVLILGAAWLAACGGGSDSGEDVPAAGNGTSGVSSSSSLVTWTKSVCKAAITFRESTSQFSTNINRIDLHAAGAQQKVLDQYADFAAKLKKYRETVSGLKTPGSAGGAEARKIWLEELQVSIDRNASLVAEVRALAPGSFGDDYLELIVDFRDEFSEQDLRGRLLELAPAFPAVESIIATVDNTAGCADAAFE